MSALLRSLSAALAALLLLSPAFALAQDSDMPAAATTSEEEDAGDVSEVDKDAQGPLRERIRPVSGRLFSPKGRFELSPSGSVSLRDAFYTKYLVGGTLTYHPLESLGLGLRVGYSIPVVSGTAQICTFDQGERGCRKPTEDELDRGGLGNLRMVAGLDAKWAPIYGKLSLLSSYFATFDMYGIVGASYVQYQGPTANTETGVQNYWTPGANVGVGFHVFLNRWISLRTELRDLIYVEKTRQAGEDSLRNQLLFELGLSFFFPSATPES
ncbi:MAG TPA: outer membrane beta-barrel domain-containing protein [Aggregicoccus sp.]|nr:outer membrane beta-barrel domain-containing protein [Aggregicoccus sp.]